MLRLACLTLALVIESSIAFGAEYVLGPQDRIRLMVVEWRPARAEVFAWTALNSEFTVSPSGNISLPLLGSIRADSKTVEQLGVDIAEQLQVKMGLVLRPTASVEISQFRPIYVTGDVANPGEFPYRPDLSVLKTVSLAGGIYRPNGANIIGLERDAIVSRGDLRSLAVERTSLLAKQARLEAEVLERSEIEFSTKLTSAIADPDVADAMREEKMVFISRRNSIASKTENLKAAKVLLEREIDALVAKDGSIAKQLALAVADRENVSSLASKGLAVSARQISSEQAVAQMETSRLDIGIARVRADQQRSKLDRDLLEFQDQRQGEILLELRMVEGKINDLREKAITGERLAFNAELQTAQDIGNDSRDRVNPSFMIIRSRAGRSSEIIGMSTTILEPGDVLQVTRLGPTVARPPTVRGTALLVDKPYFPIATH